MGRAIVLAGVLAVMAGQAAGESAPFRNTAAPAIEGAVIPLGAAAGEASADRSQWGSFFGQTILRNVSAARMIAILPKAGTATGAAVVVAPGGGFDYLAVQAEGLAPARWLAEHGVAAFVLLYRTHATAPDAAGFIAHLESFGPFEAAHAGDVPVPPEPEAGEDALAALAFLRAHAGALGIDPARVGMLGFSAGAITAMMAAQAPSPAARPAFVAYVYGPMRAPAAPVAPDAPPLFAALALNDELFGKQGFGLIEAWRAAGRPAELHGYQSGGHGFGVGEAGKSDGLVMEEILRWLQERGVTAPAR